MILVLDTKPSAAATAKQEVSATPKTQPGLPARGAGRSLRAETTLKALQADTGALSGRSAASNLPGVTKAGRKLASDAIVVATLPIPPRRHLVESPHRRVRRGGNGARGG